LTGSFHPLPDHRWNTDHARPVQAVILLGVDFVVAAYDAVIQVVWLNFAKATFAWVPCHFVPLQACPWWERLKTKCLVAPVLRRSASDLTSLV